jgi:hypothetical protein
MENLNSSLAALSSSWQPTRHQGLFITTQNHEAGYALFCCIKDPSRGLAQPSPATPALNHERKKENLPLHLYSYIIDEWFPS